MLNHFNDCIRTAKTNKLEVLQINIFTALLSGLKGIVEDKTSFGGGRVVEYKQLIELLIIFLLKVRLSVRELL